MEHIAKIEVTLTGDAAQLYEVMLDAAGKTTKPGQINRSILETGLVHHLLMLSALGVIPTEQRGEVYRTVERISEHTIMKELFAHAREYWDNMAGAGTIKLEE